ncbi:hypothetical protein IAU60_001328 [Kwoniella sp. DSM 27419]
MSIPDSIILILHQASLDPSDFVKRLTQGTADCSEDGSTVWSIDNKYYSADVRLECVPLVKSDDGSAAQRYDRVEVLVYAFDGDVPVSLPPTLVRMLSVPRDIALAVRVLRPPSSAGSELNRQYAQATSEASSDLLKEDASASDEIFDEIGLEFIDEVHPITEDDDERPLAPLETLRQTLMTHMWPNMIRKSLTGAISSQVAEDASSAGSACSSASSLVESPFPTTFTSGTLPSTSTEERSFPGQVTEPLHFPGLDELRAAIHEEDFAALDRLDRLGDGFGFEFGLGPADEEYARLDDWLDGDDGEAGFMPLDGDEDGDEGYQQMDEEDPVSSSATAHDEGREAARDRLAGAGVSFGEDNNPSHRQPALSSASQDRFDDDFEFTAFQSAPPANAEQTLAMDPTPLLLHLQTVRAELAGVQDEDERRVRAGREVAQILASLGMGDDEGSDLGLDEVI